MAMLADIEAASADECLVKIADVLDKYRAYPWPAPSWWEKYETSKGNLRHPDRDSEWYVAHDAAFAKAKGKTPDGIVRFTLRFRND